MPASCSKTKQLRIKEVAARLNTNGCLFLDACVRVLILQLVVGFLCAAGKGNAHRV